LNHILVFSVWQIGVLTMLFLCMFKVRIRRKVSTISELEAELSARLNGECTVELIYNEGYTDRINALREKAKGDAGGSGNIAFRFLQILEHLR